MALKALLSKEAHAKLASLLGPVNDALKALAIGTLEFTEIEEGFALSVEEVDGFANKNVAKMTKALNTERSQREAAESKLRALGDLDPAKAREALTELEAIKKGKPDVEAQVEARLAPIRTKLEGDVRERDQKLAAAIAESDSLWLDQHFGRALIGKDGKPIASASLLLPAVRARLKIERDQNGVRRAVVLDDKGQPQITKKSGSSEQMGLDEFVLSLKSQADFAGAFYGSGAKGDATLTLKETERGAQPAQPTEADSVRKLESSYASSAR